MPPRPHARARPPVHVLAARLGSGAEGERVEVLARAAALLPQRGRGHGHFAREQLERAVPLPQLREEGGRGGGQQRLRPTRLLQRLRELGGRGGGGGDVRGGDVLQTWHRFSGELEHPPLPTRTLAQLRHRLRIQRAHGVRVQVSGGGVRGGGGQQVAGGGDVLGSAHLVTRQHPHLDSRPGEVAQCLGHADLQLVLHRRTALQQQPLLDLCLKVVDRILQPGFERRPFSRVLQCARVLARPRFVLVVRHASAREHERTQRLVCPRLERALQREHAIGRVCGGGGGGGERAGRRIRGESAAGRGLGSGGGCRGAHGERAGGHACCCGGLEGRGGARRGGA
mmetsp:Transcript_22977/g.54412  ORF Transcript_22977/g.54412 Transcript_22977/m.54412 type:complete len:340 (+) Transcript_22977:728-1747(+)